MSTRSHCFSHVTQEALCGGSERDNTERRSSEQAVSAVEGKVTPSGGRTEGLSDRTGRLPSLPVIPLLTRPSSRGPGREAESDRSHLRSEPLLWRMLSDSSNCSECPQCGLRLAENFVYSPSSKTSLACTVELEVMLILQLTPLTTSLCP